MIFNPARHRLCFELAAFAMTFGLAVSAAAPFNVQAQTATPDAAIHALSFAPGENGERTPALSPVQAASCTPAAAGCWIVVGLDGSDADDDSLGKVWVARLKADDRSHFTLVARTHSAAPAPSVPPSQAYVTIDPLPFPISSTETAFGIHVGDVLDTTSTSASSDTLILYRFANGRLYEVFRTVVDLSVADKTANGDGEQDRHWIIRFDTHTTNGMSDLIRHRVRPPSSNKGDQRYRWNGERYVAATAGR